MLPLGTAGSCDGLPMCQAYLDLTESCQYIAQLPAGYSADAGYPVGCEVRLPWKSFHGQMPCYCSTDGGAKPGWICLL
jgi:hypothetical protein